jgi:ribosomal protein S18 acetylase RimI-like enzyme
MSTATVPAHRWCATAIPLVSVVGAVADVSWKPLDEDPQGVRELLDRAETAPGRAGSQSDIRGIARLRQRLEQGNARGAVLRDIGGTLWGMVLWDRVGALGRRVSPILLATDRTDLVGWTGLLASLLERSDRSDPVLLLESPMPGLSAEEASALLVPRGFREYRRFRMVFPPGTPLPDGSSPPLADGRLRTLSSADQEGIASLDSVCYADSIDRFLFATETDPLAQARQRVKSLFDGNVGRFLGEASFGYDVEGRLLGATIVTREGSHFLLADVAVHPSVQGQGHARRLIRASLEAVSHEPTTPLVLAVTEKNRNAVRLYRSLGFVVEGEPVTFWADPAALGLPDPEANPVRPGSG